MNLGMAFQYPAIGGMFDAWQYVRCMHPVPDCFDVLAEAQRHRVSEMATMLVEVCSPPALLVRSSSPALDESVGFAFEGVDLLDMTSAADRPIRYGRYRAVVDLPCGVQAVDRTLPGPTGQEVMETLYLPVRHRDLETSHVLVTVCGFECLAPSPAFTPLKSEFKWLDLGAGVPSSIYDQSAWIKHRLTNSG